MGNKKLNKVGFWKDRGACWETRKCVGKKGGAPDCNAYKNQTLPCWEISETMCKMTGGGRGKACRVCGVWEKYHK